MRIRWALRYYRAWVFLSSMVVLSSLVILGSMLNQLAMDGDTGLGSGSLGVIQNLPDTHIRSIRNYELRPREKFKILQVLQPAVEFVKDDPPQTNIVLLPNSDSDVAKSGLNLNKDALKAEWTGTETDDDDDDGEVIEDEYEDNEDEDNDFTESSRASDNDNAEFQPGDFPGVVDFHKPPFKYEEINTPTKTAPNGQKAVGLSAERKPSQGAPAGQGKSSQLQNPIEVVKGRYTNGIFWSLQAEQTVPPGKSASQISSLLKYIRKQRVKSLHPPEWNRCGRPLNGMVTLMDRSVMCARYRTPHNKLILGEVMSFHLSQMLGMDNVPPVVLSWVSSSGPQWKSINYTALQWLENQTVALIDWIPDINAQGSQVIIPRLIHEAYLNHSAITATSLQSQHLLPGELSQLVQWGTMIIFDYLTGNYDRFASMQDAAEKETKPSILLEHVRNLKKSTRSGKLWLIDNESGLFDAYELLYLERKQRFLHFHRQMLRTVCVFHRGFVVRLESLMNSDRPDMVLLEYARSQDILLDSIPRDNTDKSYGLFHSKFGERLREVLRWISQCKAELSER